jgi:hypothetical protein
VRIYGREGMLFQQLALRSPKFVRISEPVYDLSDTYFPKQHLVKKLEGAQIVYPSIC